MTLRELAERLECRLEGDGALEIRRVAGLEQAGEGDVAFFANPKYPVRRRLPNDPMARSRLASFAGLPIVRDALAHGPNLARDLISQTQDLPLLGGLARKAVDLASWVSEREELEFTPEDIQGLMTVCLDDLVDITRGQQGFEYVGYAYRGPAPAGTAPTPPSASRASPIAAWYSARSSSERLV